MGWIGRIALLLTGLSLPPGPVAQESPSDWPQFMRVAAHTGDAAEESLKLPLGLVARVRLEDAVMTSPAVVGGRAFVVDQMGTAYAIDPLAGRVIWKSSPDGPQAMGSNTSSPCVAEGRVFFGTTAGTFHILNAADGRVVKTLSLGSPVVSSPAWANGSLYFQTLDAVLHCIDPDGRERWTWDHYARYQEPPEVTKTLGRDRGYVTSVDGMYDRRNYGGGDVAVSGRKVVTSFGWDIACLEDASTEAKLVWCNRAPTGGDGPAPMSPSISGDWVYASGMGADGVLSLTRLSLQDGRVFPTAASRKREGRLELDTFPWSPPAVRRAAVAAREYPGREYRGQWYNRAGVILHDFDAAAAPVKWRDETDATPIVASQALAKEHLVAASLRGEVLVFGLTAKSGAQPFRYRTPNGKGIGSSPAVSGGRVHFGCDDGYFYVLGPEGALPPTVDEALKLHEPRASAASATGRKYGWTSTNGNSGNTSFANDSGIKPPLRLRWATRGLGHFKAPCIADEQDLFSVTLQGLVTCQEQATGRTRWRVALPGPESQTGTGLLVHAGRLFVARPQYGRPEGVFHCLDVATGKILWSVPIGGRSVWERSSPVVAGDLVTFGSTQSNPNGPPGAAVKAWNLQTGIPAWQVDLNVNGNRVGDIAGCTDGKVLYYTAGAGNYKLKAGEKKGGEAVALEAVTGKVLWRSTDPFGSTYPILAGGRLFLNEYFGDLSCLSPEDGKVLWKRKSAGYSRFSVGPDFLVMRGYGGHGAKIRLEDGSSDPACKELGGDTHACGAVALTPDYSFGITMGGLHVREVRTGNLLWQSPGFAPRACVNATLANGRVFFPAAASGMIYCWESK